MMETLDGRLLLYCKLMGIEPTVTEQYVRCTMPSEVILTIYKKPMRFVCYNSTYYIYASIYYPNRNPKLLEEECAHYLFNNLGEKIDELESVKPTEAKTEQQSTTPPDETQEQADWAKKLTRFVQSVFCLKNTYFRNRT